MFGFIEQMVTEDASGKERKVVAKGSRLDFNPCRQGRRVPEVVALQPDQPGHFIQFH